MYLKQLDIVGFKSFADKTKLTFDPGLIAIVGPNGSAMAPPAAGSVPEPNSSISTSVFASASCSIAFMSARKEL